MTINPAQVSTPMTWSRPDSEYIPDLMIQPQEVADLCVFAFKVHLLHFHSTLRRRAAAWPVFAFPEMAPISKT